MSPDQYASNPFVQRLIDVNQHFTASFPNISRHMLRNTEDFRGLTMFLGDTAEYVVGLRTFSPDGTPMVCWSSGFDPIMALLNLDKGCRDERFVVDKKAIARAQTLPPSDPF